MARIYKEYPSSYFQLIEKFEEDSSEVRIALKARAAWARRRDFYRFRDALRAGVLEDKYAKKIYNLLNDLVFSLSPSTAMGEEDCELVINLNPMNKAVENVLGVKAADHKVRVEEEEERADVDGTKYDTEELERIMRERAEGD